MYICTPFSGCAFFSPFELTLLIPFICSLNCTSYEPLLTKAGKNVTNCIHSSQQVKPESFVFAVWYQCTEGQLWMLECPPSFYSGPYPLSPFSFPPSFFRGPAYQGLWHLSWFYQTISMVSIFHLQFYITGHNCHRGQEY